MVLKINDGYFFITPMFLYISQDNTYTLEGI